MAVHERNKEPARRARAGIARRRPVYRPRNVVRVGGGVIKRQTARATKGDVEGFDERAEHKTTARRGYSPIDPKKKGKTRFGPR